MQLSGVFDLVDVATSADLELVMLPGLKYTVAGIGKRTDGSDATAADGVVVTQVAAGAAVNLNPGVKCVIPALGGIAVFIPEQVGNKLYARAYGAGVKLQVVATVGLT